MMGKKLTHTLPALSARGLASSSSPKRSLVVFGDSWSDGGRFGHGVVGSWEAKNETWLLLMFWLAFLV